MADIENIDVTNWIDRIDDFWNFFKKYSIVLIDCPPSLNAFSRLGLMMTNYIFCPLVPEPYCFDGLTEAIGTINKMKKLNEKFIGYKALISSHELRRTKVREYYIDSFKEEIGNKLFKNVIPNFVGIVERGIAQMNIFDMYSKKEKAIVKINSLMDEIDKYLYEERGI